MTHVVLDVTRSLQRAARRQPITGVDRVEVTYLAEWLKASSDDARFIALGQRGWRWVARPVVARLVASAEETRHCAEPPPSLEALRSDPGEGFGLATVARSISEAAYEVQDRYAPASADLAKSSGAIFLKASHDRLDRAEAYAALAGAGVRPVVFVHDVQPFDVPEFFTPGEFDRHRLRMETVARHAARVLVNSEDTAERFLLWCRKFGWREPTCSVLPLGVPESLEAGIKGPAVRSATGHFAMLGTVQPRKNHVFMLQLWRQLAEERGELAPKLVIIGRRGWLSDPVFRMLHRSPVLARSVIYAGALNDAASWAVLRGARALLMPSHAEGYALPIAEALALGVPVIASDLPAHREVGGALVRYLDPLDGPGWLAAIRQACDEAESMPDLSGYRAPSWRDHLDRLYRVLAEVSAA